jgi:Flp pilus assembly protein TadG
MIIKKHYSRSGQSLVEFCLICVTAGLLIVFGTIDISRMVSLATRMTSIAREGGRLYIAEDIDPTTKTSAEFYSEVRTTVYDNIKNMIKPQGNLDTHGKIIISVLIRRDPNNDTVYTNPTTYDDDYIELAYQVGYPSLATVGWQSKVGPIGTHIPTTLLPLDMLRVNEQTVAVEVFHENNMITPVSALWKAVAPEYLYDIAYF